MIGATALASATLATAQPQGRLAGLTQISFGCPGPVRQGEQCERWLPYADAHFRVAGRVVVSDVHGRFSVLLPVGTYRVTPLPGAHTRGGILQTVRIAAGQTLRILVRFVGFPQMV
jgi:hypothetical protein